jgi:flagellar basal-body rod modification protein FlgD
MDIQNAQAAQATALASRRPTEAGAVLSSDFETFLKMLTAQARYQDPLEPIDSTEYAAQLAQFSMVEQQVLSNDLLTALSEQFGTNSFGQMASWIGMEARTTSAAAFNGDPVTVLPTIEPGADEAVLIAYDATGREVDRRQIAVTGDPVEWSGTLSNGDVLPAGNYSFQVESRSIGTAIGTSTAENYTRITEARREGNSTVFILASGEAVTSAGITALREAGL